MNDILNKYLKFIKKFLFDFYTITLKNKNSRKISTQVIDKYLSVRYFNKTVYTSSFISKLNKEIKNVIKNYIKENNDDEEASKKAFILFGYILYFDDCTKYDSLNGIIKTLIEDEKLELNFSDEEKEKLKNLITNYVNTKRKFLANFENSDFEIKKIRYAKNIYNCQIKRLCTVSNLYNEKIIDEVFGSGIVYENKQFLLLYQTIGLILNEINNLNYDNHYLINFPASLFKKDKKINKYLRVIDNDLVKNKISFCITYGEYLDFQEKVNTLISRGYSISVILDESFDSELQKLIIFSYVLLYEKYDFYDIIMENRDNIMTRIIVL